MPSKEQLLDALNDEMAELEELQRMTDEDWAKAQPHWKRERHTRQDDISCCQKSIKDYKRSLTLLEEIPMDPEANVEEQLYLARQIEEIYDGSEEISQSEAYDLADLAMRLAELVLAKAEWDRKAGA